MRLQSLKAKSHVNTAHGNPPFQYCNHVIDCSVQCTVTNRNRLNNCNYNITATTAHFQRASHAWHFLPTSNSSFTHMCICTDYTSECKPCMQRQNTQCHQDSIILAPYTYNSLHKGTRTKRRKAQSGTLSPTWRLPTLCNECWLASEYWQLAISKQTFKLGLSLSKHLHRKEGQTISETLQPQGSLSVTGHLLLCDWQRPLRSKHLTMSLPLCQAFAQQQPQFIRRHSMSLYHITQTFSTSRSTHLWWAYLLWCFVRQRRPQSQLLLSATWLY